MCGGGSKIESCLPVPMSDGGYRREEERGNNDEKVNIDLGLISGCRGIDMIMKKRVPLRME